MKKITVIILVLALIMSFLPLQAQAVSGGSGLTSENALGGSDKYLATAKAAILYELNTDTLVYAYEADKPIDPTGMVKLLTALVALEEGDLDALVSVSRSALDSVGIGAVSAELKRGEEMTLRDLLYCVMVASANDACAVIAEYIGGSIPAFVEKMNQKALELGCTGSSFTNPTGLYDPEQRSTARDLAIITEAALDNPLFSEMFSRKSYTVPATNKSEARELKTTNHMMSDLSRKDYVDSRVTGGKPAAATTSDRSMICTAQVGTSRYLCVVMSAQAQMSPDGAYVVSFSNFLEAGELLDYGFHHFTVRQVVDSSQVYGQYHVSDGESAVLLQPEGDLYTVLPKELNLDELKYMDVVDISKLTAPLQAGTVMGTLHVRYGDVILGSCNLVTMYTVHENGSHITEADRLEPEVKNNSQWVRWVLFGVIGLCLLAILAGLMLLLLLTLRNRRIKRRRRRRMAQRKRRQS